MKKISAIFLICVLVLVGCGGGGQASKDEAVALDYINTYLNGTDKEAKKKFVEEKVHPEAMPLFAMGMSLVTPEKNMYKNPKVIESTEYEKDGEKATLVLLTGTVDGKDKEIIILTMDGKVGFGFTPDSNSEDMKKNYEEMRSKFKTEPLK
ncbi:hypothetical protein [Paenibacillus popilliae]|uniref:DUF1310 family protein n=1 Tax=Paenibacillus popilliae TaxID=78057 RepID=A0ABY3AWD3_PAEPP|nr:hypothetical protein [Paenibacillus sp. SDF0028]TQR47117.1 hypothetical protein C7Y44_05685 [Paenibacillus sp. SDF0028]